MSLLASFLTFLALVLCVPVVVLSIEIFAALIFKERVQSEKALDSACPRIAVLIPAHNEEAGLLSTIVNVRAQLRPGDRVLVVADNCTDDTANIAHSGGADVIERHDPERIGKGFALDFGLRHLQADPPDIVVMVDADCRLAEGALCRLSLSCAATGRPMQALYLMKETSADESTPGQGVAHFAWIVKTYLRPIGLAALGLPCQLMGTGMAFPWEAIRAVELASGNLVEDLKLGLDLAAIGMAPHLCRHTYVESAFSTSESGRTLQRQRWEVGSVTTLLADTPGFLCKALLRRNLSLFVLALDASVPPLAFLAATLVVVLSVAALAALAEIAVAPLLITTAALVLFATTLVVAWAFRGRTVLPMAKAGHLLPYLFQKFRVYRLRPARRSRWIRTERQ